MELPDRTRASQSYPALSTKYVAASCRFSDRCCELLRQIAGDSPDSNFTVVLSAVVAILHRFTGLADVAVEIPGKSLQSNRRIFSTRFVGGVTMREHLLGVRERLLNTWQNPPEASPQSQPRVALTLQARGDETIPIHVQLLLERESGVAVTFDQERFGADLPKRLLFALDAFISALASPSRICGEIELLSPEELSRLNQTGSGAVRDYPLSTIHGCFQQQTAVTPQRPAIITASEQVSYAQLNDAADTLARRLQFAYRIRKGDRVAILMDSSPLQVLSTLSVLKAGGICVPLSPDWPQLRLDSILKSASPSVVIQSKSSGIVLPVKIQCLELTSFPETLAPTETASPIRVFAGDLAYLIYTSGSTGEPKGVAVSHGSLVNMALDQIQFVGVTLDDRLLQVFAPVFDASWLVLTLALFSGAALVIANRKERTDTCALEGLINHVGPTVAAFVPSAFRTIDVDRLNGIRTLIFGGEPLTGADVERAGRGRRIINSYGATETAVCVCAHDASECEHKSPIPVGVPVANTWVNVIDRNAAPVPVGSIGEIAVAGRALAQGYWNDPLATAEHFTPHPTESGMRLYRTGDRGKRLADGSIHFLDRMDRQLKIRGHRVEPSEIERVILRLPGIVQAYVEARTIATDPELVAYVSHTDSADEKTIKTALVRELPDFMTPAHVVIIPTWPLTHNGKTDVRALRAQELAPSSTASHSTRSSLEARLRTIWETILGRGPVGVEDDFFTLGGESLKAMRLLARIRNELGLTCTLSDFFSEPTISGLIAHAESAVIGAPLQLPRAAESSSYPASFAQESMWLLHHHAAPGASYHIPRCYVLKGVLDREALQRALDELVKRHEPLRAGLVHRLDGIVQEIASIDRVQIDDRDLRHKSIEDDTLRCHIREEITRPFVLDQPLKLRAHLFRLTDTTHVLLLTIHHIASDGWSMHLLLQDLSGLYVGRSFPTLSHNYRDFVLWQREYVSSAKGQADRDYWRSRLNGLSARARLPADLPRKRDKKFASAVVRRHISRVDADALRSFAGTHHGSVFAVLVATLKMLLHDIGCGEDIAVGAPAPVRLFPETEQVAGLFLNMLVLRDRVADGMSISELLPNVQATINGALDHQAYPFELVAPQEARPLFDVEIDFRPAEMEGNPYDLRLAGLDTHPFHTGFENAGKFDLDFLFTEQPDGITLHLYFDKELFLATTADRLADNMLRMLERVRTETDFKASSHPSPSRNTLARRARLAGVRERSQAAVHGPVRVVEPEASSRMPASVELNGPVTNGEQWLRDNRQNLNDLLKRYGGIVFRGFQVDTVQAFSTFLQTSGQSPISYEERSSRRHSIGANVYTSTDHPADQDIRLHTEHSYAARWPMRIAFACLQPAAHGGATPTADTRRVLAALRDKVVAQFRELGVAYVRNFGSGLGLDWPEAFGTHNTEEVERYCASNDMQCQWLSTKRLRVQWRRPALRRHPETGEWVWFNHAYFFNVLSLDSALRDSLLKYGRADDLPFQTYYGDGSPIEKECVEAIESALQGETHNELWRKGDVLLLDNMLRAHGRTAYSGERLIAVAMSDIYESKGASA